MRIIHCFRSPVGGLFRHVRDLVAAQRAAGHEVGIICDASTGGAYEDGIFAEIEPQLALGLTRIPMRRQISPLDLVSAFGVLRKVRELDPDIMHGHGAKGGAFARMIGTLLRVSGCRVARIYTPHGGSLHHDPASTGGRVYFFVERQLERLTDALIFVSRYEAETYRAKVGEPFRQTFLALNGLRPEEFLPIMPDSGARDFLYIGMMRDLKGPDVFIGALAALRDRRGKAPTAYLVGDGNEISRYEALVRKAGLSAYVDFHAAMPARRAFAMARAVVVPSRAESMPYIVLEATAAGMPVVATRVGGIPEIFAGESARLVAPGDPAALAKAMNAILDDRDKARTEAEALRESVRERFSIAAMARSVEAAYKAALG